MPRPELRFLPSGSRCPHPHGISPKLTSDALGTSATECFDGVRRLGACYLVGP